MATIEDFLALDVRIGTIIQAAPLEKAKKPAITLEIDFGDIGIKKSSAQITHKYSPKELVGRQVVGIVNFPPRKIAGFTSEVLILGGVEGEEVTLIAPDEQVKNGTPVA